MVDEHFLKTHTDSNSQTTLKANHKLNNIRILMFIFTNLLNINTRAHLSKPVKSSHNLAKCPIAFIAIPIQSIHVFYVFTDSQKSTNTSIY